MSVKKYTVTMNEDAGNGMLSWGPPYWLEHVRARSAVEAVRMVCVTIGQDEHTRGKILRASHKSGECATLAVGAI